MSRGITIYPVQHGTSLRVPLGDGPAKLVTAGTGWAVKARASNVGLVDWQGIEPLAQEIPIMFDRFDQDQSVESEIQALLSMAGIGRRDFDGVAPSAVRVRGPIRFADRRWVISGIDEDDGMLRLPRSLGGSICRWPATLKLIEWIDPDQIRMRRHRRGSGGRKGPVFYEVRKGDTLAKIAKKWLGDASKWQEIGRIQKPPLRDPRKELKVGAKIRLPGYSGLSERAPSMVKGFLG